MRWNVFLWNVFGIQNMLLYQKQMDFFMNDAKQRHFQFANKMGTWLQKEKVMLKRQEANTVIADNVDMWKNSNIILFIQRSINFLRKSGWILAETELVPKLYWNQDKPFYLYC